MNTGCILRPTYDLTHNQHTFPSLSAPAPEQRPLLYLFQGLEELRVGGVALHGVGHDGLGQRLGGAGLAHQEEGDAQLHAHHHHEHVLLQRLVLGNVVLQTYAVQEHVLTSATGRMGSETNNEVTQGRKQTLE